MSANTQSVSSGTTPPWVEKEIVRLRTYLKAEKMTKATADSYARSVHDFLLFVGKPVDNLTRENMQTYKEDIAEDYCENSMINMIAAVNLYTGRLYERPDLRMRSPKPVQKDKIPLTELEVKQILEEAKKPRKGRKGFPGSVDFSMRDHAAICLMYYGMLRADEVCNLRISGLDLDNLRVRVHAGKGKNYQTVNITTDVVESVKKYIEQCRSKSSPGCEDILFLSSAGGQMKRNAIWSMVKRIAFWAGIEKNVHPHIFRHSAITHMSEKGLNPSFIQAQSRHKSLDDVMKYTHLSDKATRQAYDRVFSPDKPEPIPTPAPPEPSRWVQPANTEQDSPDTIRDRILLKYLEGELSDEKLDRLLSIVDQQPKEEHKDSRNRMPGYL